MTITLNAERRRRTELALIETHRLLAKELTYSAHLQDSKLVATYRQHIENLEKALNTGSLTVN